MVHTCEFKEQKIAELVEAEKLEVLSLWLTADPSIAGLLQPYKLNLIPMQLGRCSLEYREGTNPYQVYLYGYWGVINHPDFELYMLPERVGLSSGDISLIYEKYGMIPSNIYYNINRVMVDDLRDHILHGLNINNYRRLDIIEEPIPEIIALLKEHNVKISDADIDAVLAYDDESIFSFESFLTIIALGFDPKTKSTAVKEYCYACLAQIKKYAHILESAKREAQIKSILQDLD